MRVSLNRKNQQKRGAEKLAASLDCIAATMMRHWIPSVKQRLGRSAGLVIVALSAVGCSDGDHLPPAAVLTSGVSGGPLGDTLTVHAVSAENARPIAGATVWLGAGQEAKPVGRTAWDGSLVVSGLAAQAQTVTVGARGYAAASWGLITSAVATIPLESQNPAPPNETVTVSIAGWNALPPVAEGSYRLARFAYSRPNSLGALEADLSDKPLECRGSSSCTVMLSVPADSSEILAVIADGTDPGTPDDASDDSLSMVALAAATNLTLRPAGSLTIALPVLERSALVRATVTASGGSGGVFEEVVGVPGVSLNGQILVYPSLGGHASFLVPSASGAFQSAKLWAVATAGDGSQTDWSRSYARGIEPPAPGTDDIMALRTEAFLQMPSIHTQTASDYDLQSDGSVQRVEVSTASGQRLNALLFPVQSQFSLPAGVLSEAPNDVSVEVFDSELDLSAFALDDLVHRAAHIAYAEATP